MFFLINKPLNLTSFDVIRKLKKILDIKKIGHTGTLDPLATGCLVIATGNSTKLIRYLEKDTKTYKATICFNAFSKTGDREGEIYPIDKSSLEILKEVNIEKIKSVINNNFIGKIKQVPSKYSAIKINGKSAYKYMREGNEDFEIPEREVEIFKFFELDFYEKDELYFLDIEVKVGAGTYIRTLGEDIGKALGVGGYLTSLERVAIGNLDIRSAIDIEKLELAKVEDKGNPWFYKDYEVRLGSIFPDFPTISITSELMEKILQGKKILKTDIDFDKMHRDFLKVFKVIVKSYKEKLGSDYVEYKREEPLMVYDYFGKYLFVKNEDTVCLLEQEGKYFKVTRNNVV